MIWADKLAVAVWGILVGLCFLCAPRLLQEADLWEEIWNGITHFLLPLWIVLRVIDWVTGGPGRRKRRIYYHPIHTGKSFDVGRE